MTRSDNLVDPWWTPMKLSIQQTNHAPVAALVVHEQRERSVAVVEGADTIRVCRLSLHPLLKAFIAASQESRAGKAALSRFAHRPSDRSSSIREKLELFGITQARVIQGYELAGQKWEEKVGLLAQAAQVEGHQVVFIDNVSRSAVIEKEEGVELGRAIEAFMDAMRSHGLTGIVDHHQRKTRGPDEDMSRGGTAAGGATDLNVSMFRVKGNPRQRRLKSAGRVRAANWEQVIELDETGQAYTLVGKGTPEEQQDDGDLMTLWSNPGVNATEFGKLIHASKSTAQRRLDRYIEEGKARREPDGNAYRYFFASLYAEPEQTNEVAVPA